MDWNDLILRLMGENGSLVDEEHSRKWRHELELKASKRKRVIIQELNDEDVIVDGEIILDQDVKEEIMTKEDIKIVVYEELREALQEIIS